MTQFGAVQRWMIDSIEENIASVEVDHHTMITVPVAILPAGTVQGHIIAVKVQGERGKTSTTVSFTFDEQATREALAKSAAQVNKGARQSNDPGGNVTF